MRHSNGSHIVRGGADAPLRGAGLHWFAIDEMTEEHMYTRQSPDYTQHVAQIALDYPREWEGARKTASGHRSDAFIRILTYLLNRHVDPRIGLNGKRGGDELSLDACAYRNVTAPGGSEVIDVIIGNTHTPAWQDVTIPPAPHPMNRPDLGHPAEGVLGKFIFPERPAGVLLHHVHPDDLTPAERDQPVPQEPEAPSEPGQPEPSQPHPAPGDLDDNAEAVRVLTDIYNALHNFDARMSLLEKILAAILKGQTELKLPVDTIVNLTLLSERLKDANLLAEVGAVRQQLDRGFEVTGLFSRSPKITPIKK